MNWFRDHIDPKYLKICAYASITTLATIAVGLLIYHSGGLLITGRDLIGAVATPIVYGMLLCYILLPLVRGITDWLARRNIFKDNFSARLHIGVFITVALVLLLVSAIICLLVVVITRSAENINMETLQALWSSAEGDIMRLITMAQEKLAELGFIEMSSGTGITGTLGEVTDVLSTVVVSIIIGVYFLLDGRRIVSYLKRIFVALFGEYIGPDLTQVLQDADAAFSGYLRGQVVDALLVGTVVAVSYTLISVPYGPIIGLLTGIGNLIPYIGGPVGYITTILVCLAEGNIRKLVAGVICLSVIMFIDGNLINPRLLSHAVEVHPLVVILALVAGSSIGGIAGMLIAVPTAAFVKMQLERWLTQREEELEQHGVFSRAAHAAPQTHHIARGSAKTHDMPTVLRDEMQEIKRGNTGTGEAPVQLRQEYVEEPVERPVRKKRVRRRPADGSSTSSSEDTPPRKKRRPATNPDGTPRKRSAGQGSARPRTNPDGTPRKRPVPKSDGASRPVKKRAPQQGEPSEPRRTSQESVEARKNLGDIVPQIEEQGSEE